MFYHPTRHIGTALLLSIVLITGLSACDRVSQRVGEKISAKVEQALPKPTPAQTQLATQLYLDLQNQDFRRILQYDHHPDLAHKLVQQAQLLPYLAKQIPNTASEQIPTLIAVNKQILGDDMTLLTLTYQYAYELEIIDFSVTFIGDEGSTTLYDLALQQRMNTQTPMPKSPIPTTPAAQPQPEGVAA